MNLLECEPPIVIDTGSLNTRVGTGGYEKPEVTFLTSSLARPGTTPINHGIIQNWDDLTTIFRKIFTTDVKQETSSTPVVLTSTSNAPDSQRIKLAEIFFETYSTPFFAIENSCTLNLFGSDKKTGLFIEIGEGITDIAPFYEGFGLERGNICSKLAGLSVTKYLQKILHKNQKMYIDNIPSLREIKEQYCYAWSDQPPAAQEISTGRINLRLKDELAKCSDFLFHPHMFGAQAKGVHQMIYDSIMSVEAGMRGQLLNNIYIGGGATLMKGFKERLDIELKALLGETPFQVHVPEIFENTAWFGGSIFSSVDQFEKSAISGKEYLDEGASAAYRKHHKQFTQPPF
ncbi:actin [Tritrichomonas foetus]|uniref:Actin n=1 Tax=Tritrichomonas foetus TaxID=1144522 RepID=A0A1J4J868_9EUKA|nr:actin [Tritrichomonas foetus]|eukprot:OHS94439.1 actin [Tritrichomonas foetus]